MCTPTRNGLYYFLILYPQCTAFHLFIRPCLCSVDCLAQSIYHPYSIVMNLGGCCMVAVGRARSHFGFVLSNYQSAKMSRRQWQSYPVLFQPAYNRRSRRLFNFQPRTHQTYAGFMMPSLALLEMDGWALSSHAHHRVSVEKHKYIARIL